MLALIARYLVCGVTAASIGIAVVSIGLSLFCWHALSASGSSTARLLRTVAFFAKTSLIQGFYKGSTKEFGAGLAIFFTRLRPPLEVAYTTHTMRIEGEISTSTRITAGENSTAVSEEAFRAFAVFSLSEFAVAVALTLVVRMCTRGTSQEKR
jgi:hypothetical protein